MLAFAHAAEEVRGHAVASAAALRICSGPQATFISTRRWAAASMFTKLSMLTRAARMWMFLCVGESVLCGVPAGVVALAATSQRSRSLPVVVWPGPDPLSRSSASTSGRLAARTLFRR